MRVQGMACCLLALSGRRSNPLPLFPTPCCCLADACQGMGSPILPQGRLCPCMQCGLHCFAWICTCQAANLQAIVAAEFRGSAVPVVWPFQTPGIGASLADY